METFSFSKNRLVVGGLVLAWLAWATVQDNHELKTNRHEVGIELLLTLALLASLVWLVSVRLELSRLGLSYRSLAGSESFRWREVTKLFISWRQRRFLRLVPWYRAYRVEIVDRNGRRFVFGNRFQGIAALAERIDEIAAAQLAPFQVADFRAGRTVDFAALALSAKGGVTIGGEAATAWKDVVSYEVTERELAIARRRGPPVILPLRRVSLPSVCTALLAEGLGSVKKVG